MDFLLSLEGVIYNAPALLILALLLWKRPYIGGVMVVLAFFRVGWPILGGGELVSFSVHGALVFTTMFAWRRDDWIGNALLVAAGVGMLLFMNWAIGTALPESAAQDVGMGIAIGLALTLLRAFFWGSVALVRIVLKEDPTPA